MMLYYTVVHLNIHTSNKHAFTYFKRDDAQTVAGNVPSVIPAASEVRLAPFFAGCVMEVWPGQDLFYQRAKNSLFTFHVGTGTELHVLRSEEKRRPDTSERWSTPCSPLQSC